MTIELTDVEVEELDSTSLQDLEEDLTRLLTSNLFKTFS